jgi:hypothetical protein
MSIPTIFSALMPQPPSDRSGGPMRSSDGRKMASPDTTMSRCLRGTRSVATLSTRLRYAVLQLDLDVVALQVVERDLRRRRVPSVRRGMLELHAIPQASTKLRRFRSAVADAVDCQCSHGGHVLTQPEFRLQPVAHTMEPIREEVCLLRSTLA